MKLKAESYPDKIRRIASDLSRMRNMVEVDHTVTKLRTIADELERKLKHAAAKKT